MSVLTNFCRITNCIGSYRSIIHGRTNWVNTIQVNNYTKKSAEDKLGIEKPKRPLTPFFKFMVQMRPALLAKNPGITSKEAIMWSSKHWQQLDAETKTQMVKEYEKDLEDYKKIKVIYESSLTEEQKEDIKRVKEEMAVAKEKRKLKAEYKELGKPKKPMSSFLLFGQSKKHLFKDKTLAEFQQQVSSEWMKLSDSEKAKYEKEANNLMSKYRKELDAWELKMVSLGRSDLVRSRQLKEKKSSSGKSQK